MSFFLMREGILLYLQSEKTPKKLSLVTFFLSKLILRYTKQELKAFGKKDTQKKYSLSTTAASSCSSEIPAYGNEEQMRLAIAKIFDLDQD